MFGVARRVTRSDARRLPLAIAWSTAHTLHAGPHVLTQARTSIESVILAAVAT